MAICTCESDRYVAGPDRPAYLPTADAIVEVLTDPFLTVRIHAGDVAYELPGDAFAGMALGISPDAGVGLVSFDLAVAAVFVDGQPWDGRPLAADDRTGFRLVPPEHFDHMRRAE